MDEKGQKNKFGKGALENWMTKRNPFHNFAKLLMNSFIKAINRDLIWEVNANLD